MSDEQQTSQALGLTFDFWGVKCRVLSVHKPDIAHMAYYFGEFMVKPEPPDVDVFLQTGNPERSFVENLTDPATEKKILFRTDGTDWQVWEAFTKESKNPALVPPFYLPPLLDRVLLLHGAALSAPNDKGNDNGRGNGKGLLVFGAPKSGKSLISLALGNKGFGFLADDQVVYDFQGKNILAYRRPLGIRENTWKLLGLEGQKIEGAAQLDTPEGTTFMVRAEALGLDISAQKARPAHAFFLKNEDVKELSVRKMSKADVKKHVLDNTLSIPEQHVPQAEALAESLPGLEISFQLERDWQAVVDIISREASA